MKFLNTARLVLRPVVQGDFPEIAAMDSDPEVMRYLALDTAVPTYEQALQKVPQILDWPCPEGGGVWAITSKRTGTFFGWAELGCHDVISDVEIGYRLLRVCWGKGYGTEAGRCLVDHAFQNLNFGSLVALVHPHNLASLRVIEKVGLKRSGTLESFGVKLNRYTLSRKHYFERIDGCW